MLEPQKPKYESLKPTRRDWLMVIISVLFVAAGILILQGNPSVGIVTLAFFGLCLIVTVETVRVKLRDSKFAGQTVMVMGGINIRPSRFRIFLISVLLILLGLVLAAFGQTYPPIFNVLSYLICIAGLSLLVLVVLKKIPASYFRFDSEGFVLGRKWGEVRIPWSAIVETRVADFNSNSAVFLWIKSLQTLEVSPKSLLPQAAKEIQSREQSVGAHFMILPSNYGLASPVLAEAIERYRTDFSARAELRKVHLS